MQPEWASVCSDLTNVQPEWVSVRSDLLSVWSDLSSVQPGLASMRSEVVSVRSEGSAAWWDEQAAGRASGVDGHSRVHVVAGEG